MFTVVSEVRAAQGCYASLTTVSVTSVVHHVANLTQHQSGSASVSAAAVASGASECVWAGQGGDGESSVFIYNVGAASFYGSFLLFKDGTFEVEATQEMSSRGGSSGRTDMWIRMGNHRAIRLQDVVRTHKAFSSFFHSANHRYRLSF